MKLSICTISFRHQLVSIDQLVNWARSNHFQGIELWGVHAKNLAEQPSYNKEWLASYGLHTSMISDYLPLQGSEQEAFNKVQQLCMLAKHWGAKKLRTFAGGQGSDEVTREERADMTARLRNICHWVEQHGITLIIEIHPKTLADNIESTLQLIDEVSHPSLKINFDVLHVWESGANTIDAFETLKPFIQHFHLKNIQSAEQLHVFSPPNVYSASGSREGMVSIFEGAVDYQEFLEYLIYNQTAADGLDVRNMDASLEWFGNQCKETLSQDRYKIQRLEQQCDLPMSIVS
ncbi:sugar phosphate isomerase/epimerase [Litoribacillus peritrichatus]|uniref:Sugar phosphate isomerase/epimerase n=1 Tax=Litoribacillus peritrichatus TaxID=718191 RepID=A0ABP7MJ09_9GAMM